MKKYLILLLLTAASVSISFSQEKYKRFAIGLHGGLTQSNGDGTVESNSGIGLGLSLKFSINNRFSLRGQWSYGGFSNQFRDTSKTVYKTNTSINEGNIQLIFNIINFRKPFHKDPTRPIMSTIYFGTGIGKYSASVNSNGTKSSPSNLMTIYSLGYKHELSKIIDLSLEYSVRATTFDYLDGYSPASFLNKNNDYYSLITAGLHFNFGNPNKNIEFTDDIYSISRKEKEKDAELTPNNKAEIDALRKQMAELEVLLKDGDRDGVSDYYDQEPNSQTDMVNTLGVTLDTDLDSVPDYLDKCPTAPGPKPEGCPAANAIGTAPSTGFAPLHPLKYSISWAKEGDKRKKDSIAYAKIMKKLEDMRRAAIEDSLREAADSLLIFFGNGKSSLTNKSVKKLQHVLDILKSSPTAVILIEGYADEKGKDEDNLKLSEKRSNKIKDFFIKSGISDSRIFSVGLGAVKPISSNDTEDGRARNRRAEMKIKFISN